MRFLRRLFRGGLLPLLLAAPFFATSVSVEARAPSGQSVTGAPGAAPGEAVLTWTVADTGGLPIKRSRLRWRERGAGNPWHRINIYSTATSYTLVGLDSSKQYVAQVRVWNADGGTRWSRGSRFSPAVAPTQAPARSAHTSDTAGGRVEGRRALL